MTVWHPRPPSNQDPPSLPALHPHFLFLFSKYKLPQDFQKTVRLLQSASYGRLGEAMVLLGECYLTGTGTAVDHLKALRCFRQAASGPQIALDLRYASKDFRPIRPAHHRALSHSQPPAHLGQALYHLGNLYFVSVECCKSSAL